MSTPLLPYQVILVRNPGTVEEKRSIERFSGDLARSVLLLCLERPSLGDELHSDQLDEPRVIADINPGDSYTGTCYWRLLVVPKSAWIPRKRPNRLDRPLPPPLAPVGGGASASLPSTRKITGSINYDFPQGLPEDSRDAIKLSEKAAARECNEEIVLSSAWKAPALRRTCVLRVAGTLCKEAVKLEWGADSFDRELSRFVQAAARWAGLPTDPESDDLAAEAWTLFENLVNHARERLSGAEPTRRAVEEPPRAEAKPKSRSIIEHWMRSHEPKLDHASAARELAISETVLSALKRGTALEEKRCGPDTVQTIAKKIGCQPSDLDNKYPNYPA